MPLTKKMQIRRAEEIGRVIAKSYYDMFKDGKHQGPNFKWENFPDMCRRGSKVQVMISFPHNLKAQEEIEGIAGDVAYNEAKRLMEENKCPSQ